MPIAQSTEGSLSVIPLHEGFAGYPQLVIRTYLMPKKVVVLERPVHPFQYPPLNGVNKAL